MKQFVYREASLYRIREPMGSQWRGRNKMRRVMVSFLDSRQGEQRCVELFVVCLGDRPAEDSQPDRRELQQSRRERTKTETRIVVAFADR